MMRLSRAQWPVVAALIFFALFETVAVYIFILDRRLTNELVSHRWSQPTEIRSSATNARIATLYGVDWRITPTIPLGALPEYVPNAFIAAEDVRFRSHFGIDPIGMARAAFADLRAHGIVEGGSTIDQQIIKARFLTQERTWRRKFVEIVLALLLDAHMSKDEILDIYLNDVYLGHNGGRPVLGVDEASRMYLDKLPSQIRLDEAAMLAAIVRAPNRDNPWKRPDIVRMRRDAILSVMLKRDWITESQYRDAVAHEVRFVQGAIPQAPYPYYLRALRSELVNVVGLRPVIEGGLTIVCEMDPDAQHAAERAAARAPAQLGRFPWIRAEERSEPVQAAILSVDPRSGGIRALVGGTNYD
ncbi:MAG TPA: transglycosylase domain-containing protein, partial [Thermoanaerobaculia bacterium]|nr:transglycosylase domain-containing protein [Thermoanaerobaculia bacterium]